MGQVGQEQPGEHLGDRTDLKDRGAVGAILGAGADLAMPDQALLAPGKAPDHQADAPPGPHGPHGPLGQLVHQTQPNRIWWSSGSLHLLHSRSGGFASTLAAPCRPVRGTAEFLQCHTQRVRARQGRLQQHQQAEQVRLRCRRRLIWLWPFADSPSLS
jgi:hypothetical protein